MACFHPLSAFRILQTGAICFSPPSGAFLPLRLPCGQCWGCRLERSRQWAVRCMHEAALYEENCFITLTYAPNHLPAYGSLDKSAFPRFMKRLRKRISPRKVRFYHAGEYGEQFGRPHYHACLFGYDFPDKIALGDRGGFPIWESPMLAELWPFGHTEIGSVTFESAAYVARYIMKKVTGRNAELAYRYVNEDGEIGHIEPEYTTMSRRPGIGQPWLDKYMTDVYPLDGVVMAGRLMKPPRFYDVSYELIAPDAMEVVRQKSREARRVLDGTEERLAVREECAIARSSLLKRGLE